MERRRASAMGASAAALAVMIETIGWKSPISPSFVLPAASRHFDLHGPARDAHIRPSRSHAPTLGGVGVSLILGVQCKARWRRQQVKRRFFGDLFGPEEVVDPEDPGRVGVCKEYQSMPGTLVASEESEFGYAVVSRHDASEQDEYWMGSPPGPITQEWRELRLASKSDSVSEGTGQSVVKVSLCDGEQPQQVPYCMALAYTKSLVAAALSGAQLQGALPLSSLEELPTQRALVIGLGAGSIPIWLQHTFQGKMVVDALEIDPAVVKVATELMGFPASAIRSVQTAEEAAKDATSEPTALRVYGIPGEDFVEALAALGETYQYDLVFIDAFDKSGKVPPVLVDAGGTFLQSLNKVLSPKATIVMNLLVGMTGTGSSGGPQEIEDMVKAIHGTCCNDKSEVFAIRTPINESSGNQIYGFLRAGRDDRSEPLKEALKTSAEAVNADFPEDSCKPQFALSVPLPRYVKTWPRTLYLLAPEAWTEDPL